MTVTCDQRTSILRAHMSRMTSDSSDRFPVFFREWNNLVSRVSTLPFLGALLRREEGRPWKRGWELKFSPPRFHEGRTRRKGQSFMTEKLAHEETQVITIEKKKKKENIRQIKDTCRVGKLRHLYFQSKIGHFWQCYLSVALAKWIKVGHFHHFSKISYYWNIWSNFSWNLSVVLDSINAD